MTKGKPKAYTRRLKQLMAEKSRALSQAEAFEAIGLGEPPAALWSSAAGYEEKIAPLLDAIGREAEAALHRVSAALAGPLTDDTQADVQKKLAACLRRLSRARVESAV